MSGTRLETLARFARRSKRSPVTAPNRWRSSDKTPMRIWAHRGDSAHVTENTCEAFDAAVTKRADGVEFDVRCDKDGNVVVFHDDDLQRLCGRAGTVEGLRANELAEVRLKGGERIPSLAQAIEACGDLELDVEIKSSHPGFGTALAHAVADALANVKRPERILVTCFDPFALAAFRLRAPSFATGYLFHADQARPLREGWPARLLGAACVNPDDSLVTRARVQAWQRNGYAVNVWTVDDPMRLRELESFGVDGVFTNDPAATRIALGR